MSEILAIKIPRTFVASLLVAVVAAVSPSPSAQVATAAAPQRVISLVPAATEMVFAVGEGARLVGVSSFDKYPPQVTSLPKLGALVDPDVERIIALRPDLVIVYATQDELRAQLQRAGIAAFVFQHRGMPDIPKTMRELGTRLGNQEGGAKAAGTFEAAVDRVRRAVGSRPAPKTLLVFGRDPSSLRNIYASGGVGFLHDGLVAAGGQNVFADVQRELVQASTEMILARAPEAIIELQATGLASSEPGATARAWQRLSSVPAVRTGRITALRGDQFVSSGPRFATAVEQIARALHPDAF